METHNNKIRVGTYYKTKYGGGQITIPKYFVEQLNINHLDKVKIVKQRKHLIITPLTGAD